jgi:hypothetical protein
MFIKISGYSSNLKITVCCYEGESSFFFSPSFLMYLNDRSICHSSFLQRTPKFLSPQNCVTFRPTIMNPRQATKPAISALMAHDVFRPLRVMLHAWHQWTRVPEKSDKVHKNNGAFLTYVGADIYLAL